MSSYLLPAAECPRNNNSCERGFAHVDSPRGLKCIFILHENIYTTRVATLSAEELGTVSKNNSRGFTKAYVGDKLSHPSSPLVIRYRL